MFIYKIDFSVHNISLNFVRCAGKIFIKCHQQETVWPRRWFSNLFKCYKFTSAQFYQHDCARLFLCEDSLVFKSSLANFKPEIQSHILVYKFGAIVPNLLQPKKCRKCQRKSYSKVLMKLTPVCWFFELFSGKKRCIFQKKLKSVHL